MKMSLFWENGILRDIIKGLQAEIKVQRRELESTKEEWDTTDGAHICWWRGHDNGAKGMKAKLEKEHARELSDLRADYEARLAIRE
jgi:hypothetical protein